MSESRLPSTDANPLQYQFDKQSPAYFISNTQINKESGKYVWYAGAENLFNFHLHRPIIAADQPFSQYFDSSLVWGPIMGRNIYVGFRYTLADGESDHKH